jgi:hypothetical protein
MDPREKRFLSGEPPELIQKPVRKGKWREGLFWTEDDVPLDEDEDE